MLQKVSNFIYHYTFDGEDIFSVSKRLVPHGLADEIKKASEWIPKVYLDGRLFDVYLTEEGNELYKKTLLPIHADFVPNIVCKKVDKRGLASIVDNLVHINRYQLIFRAEGRENERGRV